MDQGHVVRHKVLVEKRSQRSVARELGLSRMTVGKYVGEAAPVRKASVRQPVPKTCQRFGRLRGESAFESHLSMSCR